MKLTSTEAVSCVSFSGFSVRSPRNLTKDAQHQERAPWSISNTRFNRFAQVIEARFSAGVWTCAFCVVLTLLPLSRWAVSGELGARAIPWCKQIRAVFVCGLAQHNGLVLKVACRTGTWRGLCDGDTDRSTPGVFPIDYSLDWVFTSKVDCYEPNDASANDWPDPVAVAKAIPLDRVIKASSIAGYVTNSINSPRLWDWYKFTIDEPLKVVIGTIQIPDDVQVLLRLFSEAGGVILDTGNPAPGW
jgi:hypothetical protein